MNPYYYLFYRIYSLFIKRGGNCDSAVDAIVLLSGMNFTFLYIKIFNISKYNSKPIYITGIVIFIVLWFVMNYFIFQYKERYIQIINVYKNESAANKRFGTFLVITYIILSIILLFFT